MEKLSKDLKEKISKCKIFIILGTKGYLKSLRRNDKDITNQVNIARELKKPFVIIKDRRLSKNDLDDINKYFSNDNVIKEITVDIGSKESSQILASEIRQVMDCLYPGRDRMIDLIYPYDEDDDKEMKKRKTKQKI
jgi:hypothetical protein